MASLTNDVESAIVSGLGTKSRRPNGVMQLKLLCWEAVGEASPVESPRPRDIEVGDTGSIMPASVESFTISFTAPVKDVA